MKFKATSYHLNLLKDTERLAVFKEAIDDFGNDLNDSNLDSELDSNLEDNSKIAFDLGCGSGVLSYFAKDYFDKIIAIDLNSKIIKYTKENLAKFDNIEVYCSDVIGFDFDNKADLIICEMLDTGLIDEEEVPVLNYAKNFLKEDGKIIPQGIINSAELIYMKSPFIQYEDKGANPKYEILSDSVVFSEFDFLDDIDENFSKNIKFKLSERLFDEVDEVDKVDEVENRVIVNGIKLTTFTKLNDNIISGPSPMLNPCLLIPIDEVAIGFDDILEIELSYVMGQGIETIRTKIIDNGC